MIAPILHESTGLKQDCRRGCGGQTVDRRTWPEILPAAKARCHGGRRRPRRQFVAPRLLEVKFQPNAAQKKDLGYVLCYWGITPTGPRRRDIGMKLRPRIADGDRKRL